MQTVRVLVVDAFTDEPLAGNAAGVVPDATGLNEAQRQAIARELSVSETAFLAPGDVADYRVQFYTPTQPVELCGHATVGAVAGLAATGALDGGRGSRAGDAAGGTAGPLSDSAAGDGVEHSLDLETPVGTLSASVEPDGTVWAEQADHSVRRVSLDRERIADALGLQPSAVTDLSDELPLAVASTGLRWLLVPVTYLSELGDADPDLAAVEALADEVDAIGVYPFTFDTLSMDAQVHARAFAPGAGVPEDPATGTAAGALAGFLRHVGAFDGDIPAELGVEQGHYVDRPSRIRVRTVGTIAVGGAASVALDGRLAVPEDEEAEILEA